MFSISIILINFDLCGTPKNKNMFHNASQLQEKTEQVTDKYKRIWTPDNCFKTDLRNCEPIL